jgi:cyclic beta-1,2-glucan synthetase
MWPAELISVAVGALVLLLRPGVLPVASPFLLLWAASPFVAYWVSRRGEVGREELAPAGEREARLIARRAWRFFETFVSQEDQWLPPDNFQEDPRPVVAHRTSPTNTGLLLLSNAAAHDFGYAGTLELVERLELTFDAIEKMPKFRGHLFNWYDTRTLEPLPPQYVSTVDSGNLAGHLLALKQACVEMSERPFFGAHARGAGRHDCVASP